ncbi:MAG: radical SAM family heme chaperone HemW [Bacteroidaceae bacterium]|nr:radical SAM family heme chaperone HemW [Bacteroidaceae bacterium]
MAGIYIHIPFCRKRCIYCDFYSTTLLEKRAQYVAAVCRELEMRKDYLKGEPIQTIYLGGGTPSLLPISLLQTVFQALAEHYSVAPDAEITMEANPDDLSSAYIQDVVDKLPINRLSMGVQTFNDEALRFLNRRHTGQQAIDTVKRCQEAGLNNISIDLIYGLPNESLEDWEKDLRIATSLHVQHISAYHLMYEEGSPLWRLRESMNLKEADEDLSLLFFEKLVNTLKEHGFQHYEISNFCLPGMHSRHNSSYWTGVPYLGCGAAAHSYNGASRQWNVASLTDYIQGINQGKPVVEMEQLDLATRYNEYVMTGLRTCHGISTAHIKEEFGESLLLYFTRQAAKDLQQGHLEKQGDRIQLSRQGIFISDGIMSNLMFVAD